MRSISVLNKEIAPGRILPSADRLHDIASKGKLE